MDYWVKEVYFQHLRIMVSRILCPKFSSGKYKKNPLIIFVCLNPKKHTHLFAFVIYVLLQAILLI